MGSSHTKQAGPGGPLCSTCRVRPGPQGQTAGGGGSPQGRGQTEKPHRGQLPTHLGPAPGAEQAGWGSPAPGEPPWVGRRVAGAHTSAHLP